MIGRTVGQYRIEAQLGAGGMGVVYRGYDTRLRRIVALKVLRGTVVADDDRKRRITREARMASSLNHPNIVTVYDIGTADGIDFIAMEYVAGTPLRDAIPPRGLPIDVALGYGLQIAKALAAAHAAGLVHRDVKPGNILVSPSADLKVVDFGLARVTEQGPTVSGPPGVPVAEASTQSAFGASQQEGLFCGTPGYAAPEQVEGGPTDSRSDVFAAGVVLYEMLAGRPAFNANSRAATLAATLHDQPSRLKAVRPDVPADLERIVQRCLEKDPAARYPSGAGLLDDLVACHAGLAARHVPLRALLRHRGMWGATLVVTSVILAAGVSVWLRQSRVHWARTVALPQAVHLIGEGRNYQASRLLLESEAYIADDPVLRDLLSESTTTVTVETVPTGARVEVRDFFSDPNAWETLGHAPIANRRLAIGPLVWRVSADGFQTIEVVKNTQNPTIQFALDRPEDAPRGMVRVPAGRLESIVRGGAVSVAAFWIDQYEVTNRQFKMFTDGNGYATREYWADPILKEGVPVSWEETMRLFRDPTGRPGPSTWELGTYPEGQADFPVGGISWYEAAAYCRSAGKQLPTLDHWYHAASFAGANRFAAFGNFASQGPAKIGHPLRLGLNGTYDMAGNVKEWIWNEGRPGRRYLLGGGWNEPSYMFHDYDAQRTFDRAPTHGVRCAKYAASPPPAMAAPIEPVSRDYRSEAPVSDEVFAIYRQSIYGYHPAPLDPRIASVDDTPKHWRVERVDYAAAYGNERVPALLFVPKQGSRPHQVVVFFPGANAFWEGGTMGDLRLMSQWISFLVRSGRAVLFPNYKGSYERFVGRMPDVNVWREIVIHASKDLRRGIDYLETRSDIDAGKVAYFGLSMGGGAGPIMTALEPRFKASVLLGGGLYSWRWTPDTDPLNFLSRVRAPTLMINGRHDYFFPVETSQRPMFDRLGTPASDKAHRIFESGHVPSERQQFIKEILDWLDKYLGPVS